MNDYYKDKKYFVYRHVAPNGNMYIGITSKSTPEERWGRGGNGYKSNAHFWSAIQKYGWDNFEHIIVAHGLPVDTACRLESYLITKYNTMEAGYNQTSGGIRPTEITSEIRQAISCKVRAYHASLPEGAWSAKFKGHVISESARRKQSAKLKGRKVPQDIIDRRVVTFKKNLTPEIRYRIGSATRGKHLSEAARLKISAAHTGKIVTAETRQKLSQSLHDTYANSPRVWVHRANEECWIDIANLPEYISSGYVQGRCNVKNIYISRCGQTIKITESDLDSYLIDGWARGFDSSRHANLRKSQQKFIYSYKGNTFNSGEELAQYLRVNGYPKIVQGTINVICQGKTVLAYPELSTEITRRPCNESM